MRLYIFPHYPFFMLTCSCVLCCMPHKPLFCLQEHSLFRVTDAAVCALPLAVDTVSWGQKKCQHLHQILRKLIWLKCHPLLFCSYILCTVKFFASPAFSSGTICSKHIITRHYYKFCHTFWALHQASETRGTILE